MIFLYCKFCESKYNVCIEIYFMLLFRKIYGRQWINDSKYRFVELSELLIIKNDGFEFKMIRKYIFVLIRVILD